MRNAGPHGLTRRAALRRAGVVALLVPFHWPAAAQHGARTPKAVPHGAFEPNAWLRITPDNRVHVLCPAVEMGQGVWTALAMLLAEELDADWSRISVGPPPGGAARPPGDAPETLRAAWEPLRQAGAAARAMLVSAAAQQWKIDPARLRTELNQVIAPDRRRLSYGALAAGAARLPVPGDAARKPETEFKLLGRPLARLDTPGKVNGSSRYGIDAQVPGMLVAVMARAPLPGATLVRGNEAAARTIDGVRQIHRLDTGFAVLADGYWAALRGRDALDVEWDLGALATLSSARVSEQLHAATTAASAPTPDDTPGQVVEAHTLPTLKAVYETPFLAQACMEPMNCTAHVRDDAVELWVGTQAPEALRERVAAALQREPAQVTVHTMLLGGGFGRRRAADFGVDAALLSMRSGRPVKLIYSREDDLAAGHYRPAAVARFEASLDAAGGPPRLHGQVATAAPGGVPGDVQSAAGNSSPIATDGDAASTPYDLARWDVSSRMADTGVPVSDRRSPDHSSRVFFIESFIDELAAAAGRDACEFRRDLVTDTRCRRVLDLVADRSDWGRPLPAGVGRGIALARCSGSVIAEVAEVSVGTDGWPKVHRIVAAVDCGWIVNPQIVRRQVEGAIQSGLSAALHGRISLQNGRVQQSNFDAYPLLRIADAPRIDVHLVPSREPPGAAGVLGTPAVAPALLNAIFNATGRRLRTLPVDPKRLMPQPAS